MVDGWQIRSTHGFSFPFPHLIHSTTIHNHDNEHTTGGSEQEGGGLSDYIAYNSVLEALKMEGDWRQALRVLRDMKSAGLAPNLVNHNTVCSRVRVVWRVA